MAETKTIHVGATSIDVPEIADYHAWLLSQASLLRNQQFGSLDWSNLAEELEAMAAVHRRKMKKQLKRLLSHLLKYRVQSQATEHHASWRRSIRNAREEISDLLQESPGLFQGKEREFFDEAYARVREDASDETLLPLACFPVASPWTLAQARNDDSIVPPR